MQRVLDQRLLEAMQRNLTALALHLRHCLIIPELHLAQLALWLPDRNCDFLRVRRETHQLAVV